MMRIIHTADWHIGQTLAGYARDHEHAAVLDALVDVVKARAADALLISGDVFDHQNPSGEAQRLFYATIVKLKAARPALQIVVTAGNHDAAGRLEAPHVVLQSLGVHVVGSVRRRGGMIDAGRHLVALRNASGEAVANVLAVSYPTAGCLPPLASLVTDDGSSPVVEATRALYAEIAERSGALASPLPLIVMGHLHVAGGLESEGAERRILVGGQHAVPASIFPEAARYVALGHLHRAQAIGRETIRYSGSLLPLSAAELGYAHGVTLLTLDGDATRIEHIPLPRPVPFLRVPERGVMRFSDVAAHLAELALPADVPLEWRPFVQLCLSREGLPPGFRAELDAVLQAFPVRLVASTVEAAASGATVAAANEPMAQLSSLSPDTLFAQAFEREHGGAPSPAHVAAFHEAYAAASGEQ
ncbi:MAG: exonuclease SbcCD subunit D [Hyphomicrobiaceae bacterium]